MHKPLLALVFVCAACPSAFGAETYLIDSRHTFPSFEVSHLGYSIQRGRFDKTVGKITLDPAARSGSIDVTIDASSISTGLPDLEKHLRGDEFFDVVRYPAISFSSSKLKFDQGRLVGAEGELTMHGVTRPAKLAVDLFHCAPNPMTKKPTCGANATTMIKRSDFGISKFVPAVGDDVKIAIQVEAIKE